MSDGPDDAPPGVAWGLYRRFALGGLLIVLLTAVGTATAALMEIKGTLVDPLQPIVDPPRGPKLENVLADVPSGKPQTLLLLGSDIRYADRGTVKGLSDTLILVRLDPDKGATSVMSLPRDLKVQIPGYGTDKINAAYSLGGPTLAVRTVKALLGTPDRPFDVHHVVNVNFGGFRRAVDRLGCVYADIDRRYFNDNDPPAGGGPDYATIDVPAGYQRLCGQDALDYVRYRHFDSDLVRAARQQDFLRQAKDQIGISRLVSDRDELLEIFGRYTQTDIKSTGAVLRLLKLVYRATGKPLAEIRFPAFDVGDHLEIGADDLRRVRERFLDARAAPAARGRTRSTSSRTRRAQRPRSARRSTVPRGLFADRRTAEDLGVRLGVKLAFPVYFPRWAALGADYRTQDSRTYDLFDRDRRRHRAYRLVVKAPGVGQYYGVQGTTWKDPPILRSPSETRRIAGRTYELYFDGSRLRMVAWRTERAAYWVHNTLLQSLSNAQMLGIAESLTRVGAA
ncbi:LCP family protein [Paraconexibacter algicola]|uniref:LytR family transcriptional regulator n=1 Tax=Paraconexibacter algicola TaxID=2133960 RepID=A0A2T4UMS8_9ACTN|nr:LCP family protein [Paraconexibacter algicola]PTL60543.1 LytR family transcriptional regulator [Paraconexibacter algicola]